MVAVENVAEYLLAAADYFLFFFINPANAKRYSAVNV